MDMHSLTVERSDWYASIQDLNDNFMHKYDITLVVEQVMDNRYNHHNRRKYSLKVHIVLVTKYRKQLLRGSITDNVK